MKVAVCVGTRPEIIKMAPVIKELIKNRIECIIINSCQHYSSNLSNIFFKELKLPNPNYNIKCETGTHAKLTSSIMVACEEIFMKEKPDFVLVHGDTDTTVACAMAASKLNIQLGHIEAGLRSYFLGMPEEKNRRIVDHISTILFAPTEKSKEILINEGIKEKIVITGNTIVDSIYQNINLINDMETLNKYNLSKRNYFLITVHRAENVDVKETLKNIIYSLELLSYRYNKKIIYPLHPRTKKMLDKFELMNRIQKIKNLIITEPLGYFEFLTLLKNALLILTDSGGLQEEACIFNVPCVTLRTNTERPETLEVGANVLAGTDLDTILYSVSQMIKRKDEKWINPFGAGNSSEIIVNALKEIYEEQNENSNKL